MHESKTLTLDSSKLFLSATGRPQSELPLSFPPLSSDIPQCKVIPNTRFLVDAFRHAGECSVSYFLSHFHADHYAGLSSSWSQGIVFCSAVTARLLTGLLRVLPPFVVALPLRQPLLIDGSEVTLVDANHCPGAVQFLFNLPTHRRRYVHTGDFRFADSMKSDPLLTEFVGSDALFLDTIYCSPKFVFPSQQESTDYIISVIQRIADEFKRSTSLNHVLFLVAADIVGKENILFEIARRCKLRVHVDGRNMQVLSLLGYGECGFFTEDAAETNVHVVGSDALGETWPYFRPNYVKMKEIMGETNCSKVVGFVPTGWTYEFNSNKFSVQAKDSLEIHFVPCSEHSNYEELREYVMFLRPKHIIPTVLDVDIKHADKMRKYAATLVDEVVNKGDALMGLQSQQYLMDNSVKEVANSDPKGLEAKKEKLFDTKVSRIEDKGFTLDALPLQEFGERDLIMLNNEQSEKSIEELHECLPTWVTRDQVLNLISSSGGNIVEAVSNFYDHETEFHEQVFSTPYPSFTSQTKSLGESASFLKPEFLKTSPMESTDIPLSQKLKSSTMKPLNKKSVSPGKKKGTTGNKPKKKAKTNSKLDSSGKGQTTITRFFTKSLSNVSSDGGVESQSDQCPEDENS